MGSMWLVFSEVCVGFKFPVVKLNFRKWTVYMCFLQISPDFVSFMHTVSVALGWETRSLTVQWYTGLKTHRTGLGIVDPPSGICGCGVCSTNRSSWLWCVLL